jgi:lipopolysaccharide transport system ATP-binding protein
MSNLALRVDGLGKMYRIGGKQEAYHTLRDTLTDAVAAPFRRARSLIRGEAYGAAGLKEEIWALKDVSFEVQHGEVVGIIGRNGAGKSTLLKILSRITEPTEGYAEVYGRVGSLLEVGTGFHPELTGRENIYLNGAILGMSREEINRKFDEIVDFAEIEKFIDTPVKHYSSGMGLRLGFAVAAHLEPEILVVDEVLAVGDAEFQKKCLGKMSDVAGEGRTVLFVSHNMTAVQNLCGRAILLEQGALICLGETANVVQEYLGRSLQNKLAVQWDLDNAPGNDKAKLLKASVRSLNLEGGVAAFTVNDDLLLEFEYYNLIDDENNLDVTVHLQDERGTLVFVTGTGGSRTKTFGRGLIRATCRIPGHLLNQGTYTISRLLLVKDRGRVVYSLPDVLTFEVIMEDEGRLGWMGRKQGVVRPRLDWTIEQPDADLPKQQVAT